MFGFLLDLNCIKNTITIIIYIIPKLTCLVHSSLSLPSSIIARSSLKVKLSYDYN